LQGQVRDARQLSIEYVSQDRNKNSAAKAPQVGQVEIQR